MQETLVEYMVYVTIQQMVGYVNVSQGLLVITALLVRNSQKKSRRFSKDISQQIFKYKEID